MIKVKLYGSTMEFKTKKKAIEYFKDGILGSEGAERDRYINIVFAIQDGKTDINSDALDFGW